MSHKLSMIIAFVLPFTAFATTVINETTTSAGLKHPGCLQSAAEINALASALDENNSTHTGYWNAMISNTRGRIDKTNWIPPTDIVGQSYAS